ncbi:MAG: hypothetical protein FWG80_01205 [Alphaproteobacteria bacterium]|nr:hypothetical protein [Alphaproteobacteria bacterium]
MKKLIFILPAIFIAANSANANPLVACPNGMTMEIHSNVTLRPGTTCNTGEDVHESSIQKCTASSTTKCWLFVDESDGFSDDVGNYGYGFCPMTS